MPAKILVFGVDAMEPKLIHDWIESGDLPNLARLRARGAWGHVLNPPRFFSGASWPNFYTGVSPARHGQYLRTLYDPTTCVHRPLRPACQTNPFWSGPDWQRKRAAILNVPYCGLDETINGLHVADWGQHDSQNDLSTLPHEVAEDLLSRFGCDPVGDCEGFECTTSALSDLRQRLIRRVQRKRDMTSHYLAGEDWDLFLSVFDETHCAGHRFWHLYDVTNSRHDPDAAATLGGTIKEIYVAIDRALGATLRFVDIDSTVLFLSSHGMGPAFDALPVFDEILRRLDGFTGRHPQYEERRARRLATARAISDFMPNVLRRGLAPVRQRFGRGHLRDRVDAERRNRRYFWLPTHDTCGGIRINLAGRETTGMVQPGRQCAELIEQLTYDLHQLRDGRSGDPIVAEIVSSADMDFTGYVGEFPDLIVRWSKASLSWIESPKIGRIEPVVVSGRSGDHDPSMRGIFFAAGPHVTPGLLPDPVRLEDFAPTISSLLGIQLPDTEGRAIPAVGPPAH
ncbi:MAG: alkaline phosphatase family protein [Deltaproteobacteria bacterium]|nr:alkaline phosphatase family protein [Deltaproteobacteria bacterium]MBI3390435.1 alkaline phosphatase family protein [Deltaproteobacteria bacterium]